MHQVQTYSMERMRTLYLGHISVTASAALQQCLFTSSALSLPTANLLGGKGKPLKSRYLKVCFYSLWAQEQKRRKWARLGEPSSNPTAQSPPRVITFSQLNRSVWLNSAVNGRVPTCQHCSGKIILENGCGWKFWWSMRFHQKGGSDVGAGIAFWCERCFSLHTQPISRPKLCLERRGSDTTEHRASREQVMSGCFRKNPLQLPRPSTSLSAEDLELLRHPD